MPCECLPAMSTLLEPIVRMAKSNQGRVLALTAVVASIAIGYSLMSRNAGISTPQKKV